MTIKDEIAAQLPDNNAERITAAILRGVLTDMVDAPFNVNQATPGVNVAGPLFVNSITVTDNGEAVSGSTIDAYGQIENQTTALRINHLVTGGADNHFGFSVATNVTDSTGGVAPLVVGAYVNVAVTGTIWGSLSYANVGPNGALNSPLIAGEDEILIATGGTALHRIGRSIVAFGQGTGTTIDAGLVMSLFKATPAPWDGAAPFHDGVYFSSNLYSANTFPIDPSGNVLRGDTGTVTDFAHFPTLTVTGNIMNFPNYSVSGAGAISASSITAKSNASTALVVGPNGATNPVLQVDASAASQATGLAIKGNPTGGGVGLVAIDSGANTPFSINAKGNGAINLGNISTGPIQFLQPFGYPAGSGVGGAVTQATSKSTGVTLNKPSGAITMNAAALAAAAKVSFVVTNSTVAATDTPTVAVASGGTANAYRAAVTAVAAGSFTVTVENITAGSLSESPVINFNLIKGTTT